MLSVYSELCTSLWHVEHTFLTFFLLFALSQCFRRGISYFLISCLCVLIQLISLTQFIITFVSAANLKAWNWYLARVDTRSSALLCGMQNPPFLLSYSYLLILLTSFPRLIIIFVSAANLKAWNWYLNMYAAAAYIRSCALLCGTRNTPFLLSFLCSLSLCVLGEKFYAFFLPPLALNNVSDTRPRENGGEISPRAPKSVWERISRGEDRNTPPGSENYHSSHTRLRSWKSIGKKTLLHP